MSNSILPCTLVGVIFVDRFYRKRIATRLKNRHVASSWLKLTDSVNRYSRFPLEGYLSPKNFPTLLEQPGWPNYDRRCLKPRLRE